MTLTEAGKEYIAQKFGNASSCLVSAGITVEVYDLSANHWTETLGSAQIVARLVTTTMYSKVQIGGVDYTYAALRTANGGNDITSTDITWIADHDDTPASGQTQYCYTAPTPPPAGYGYLKICGRPAGCSVSIDGVLQSASAGYCIDTYTQYEVTSNVDHQVTLSYTGYKPLTKTISVGTGDTKEVTYVLEAVAGANTGAVTITATDAATGASLAAQPTVDGISWEEQYVTPVTINLVVGTAATKDFNIGVKHPGYTSQERPVTVVKGSTVTANFALTEVELFRQVQVYAEMPKVAWLVDWSIAGQMAVGVRTSGWVKFTFTKKTCYRAYLDFYTAPASWDGQDIAALKATGSKARISMGPSYVLDPFLNDEYRFDWEWYPTVSPGTYWVVCTLDYSDNPASCPVP